MKDIKNEIMSQKSSAEESGLIQADEYHHMALAVSDLEGFAADAVQAGNHRAAQILLATANVLRSTVPFDISSMKN